MKKLFPLLLPLLLLLTACAPAAVPETTSSQTAVTFTDDLGRTVTVDNPQRVACLLGSFAEVWMNAGGTVIATGSTMDWAESDSRQVTMNLQFTSQQAAGSEIKITTEDGTEVFSFTPSGDLLRGFSGLILSAPALTQGQTYNVYVGGVQMAYTSTDVGGFPGGFVGRPGGMGGMPEGFDPENMPEGFDFENMPEGFEPGQMPGGFDAENMPEGFDPSQMGGGFDPENMPEGFDPSQMGGRGQRPQGDGMAPPEGFEPGQMPEGMERPEMGEGEIPQMPGGFGGSGNDQSGEPSTAFYMNDMVNSFSGVIAA